MPISRVPFPRGIWVSEAVTTFKKGTERVKAI